MAVIILQDNQVARQVNRKNKTTMACINLVLEFSISSFYMLSRKKNAVGGETDVVDVNSKTITN